MFGIDEQRELHVTYSDQSELRVALPVDATAARIVVDHDCEFNVSKWSGQMTVPPEPENTIPEPDLFAVAVSTSNIPDLTDVGTELEIDGVLVDPLVGDNVFLLVGQTTPSQNGLYVAVEDDAKVSLVRAEELETTPQLNEGIGNIGITGGDTYADTVWYLQTSGEMTLGSTALEFVQYENPAPEAPEPIDVPGNLLSTDSMRKLRIKLADEAASGEKTVQQDIPFNVIHMNFGEETSGEISIYILKGAANGLPDEILSAAR